MLRGIVFDFDLTLVDSAIGICGNLNALAREKSLPELTLEQVRPTIGWALVDAMRSFWGDGPIESEWLPRYRSLFEERNYAGVLPFADTPDVLEWFRGRGVPLAVATNRLTPRGIVRASGLEHFFDAIVGIESLPPKPAPDIVLEAARQLNVEPGECFYVGDTDIDMRTAVNAGVVPVGVISGNQCAERLKNGGAVYVINEVKELTNLWEELNDCE